MKYVIDACNLIFRDRKLEETLERQGFQAARQLLVTMMSRFAHAEGLDEVVLVFDGSEKGAHRPRQQREAAGKVLLIYADPRADADRFIIEMVEDARRPGDITVVSSDKFVVRHVARAQGRHMGCRDFLRNMRMAVRNAADPLKGEDPRKFRGTLSEREVDEWLKYFGMSGDE